MIDYPKLKGITWPYKDLPELIQLRLILENSEQRALGIENPDETLSECLVDISTLISIEPYYPESDSDEPSSSECIADFQGKVVHVFYVKRENLIAAWLFYKRLKLK